MGVLDECGVSSRFRENIEIGKECGALHFDVENARALDLCGGVGFRKIKVNVILAVGNGKRVDHAGAEISIVAPLLIQTLIGSAAHGRGNGAYVPPVEACVSLPDLPLGISITCSTTIHSDR